MVKGTFSAPQRTAAPSAPGRVSESEDVLSFCILEYLGHSLKNHQFVYYIFGNLSHHGEPLRFCTNNLLTSKIKDNKH